MLVLCTVVISLMVCLSLCLYWWYVSSTVNWLVVIKLLVSILALRWLRSAISSHSLPVCIVRWSLLSIVVIGTVIVISILAIKLSRPWPVIMSRTRPGMRGGV